MAITSNKFKAAAQDLLESLDARSRDIIVRRFGLTGGQGETLESIGKEYGVTRERVRQIESQAKKLLARRNDVLAGVQEELTAVFAAHGGILAEEHLLEVIAKESDGRVAPQLVLFYLYILPPFKFVSRAEPFGPHWSHEAVHHEWREQVVASAEAHLKKSGYPLGEEKLLQQIRGDLGVPELKLPTRCMYALLRASEQLERTVFGEWGMADWIETRPRGVGDKAYVVLRRHGKPGHFREITQWINDARFDQKRAHAQTVHNELIKDERFVLVGRGLYGLKEWGYIPGTVSQVLESILAAAGEPLTREELLKKVLEQRLVKKTTVLLGLQNSQRIQKIEGDRYTLR